MWKSNSQHSPVHIEYKLSTCDVLTTVGMGWGMCGPICLAQYLSEKNEDKCSSVLICVYNLISSQTVINKDH